MSKQFSTPKTLKQRALKIWLHGDLHRAWLKKNTYFPLEIPLKSLSSKTLLSNFSEVQEAIHAIRQDSKKHNYLISDKAVTHRHLGMQKIPVVITFETEAIFLKYLDKTAEYLQFRQLTQKSLEQDDSLFGWLERYPFKVMHFAEVWLQLLKVCCYFKAHPQPDCYIRQLDIKGVDSKFIEQHKSILSELLTQTLAETDYHPEITGLSQQGFERRYGLRYDQPLIRLRILDSSLAIRGLTDLTLTLSEFKEFNIAVKTVFIAENKINGLAFPDYPQAIVIFGLGYAVNILAEAHCLQGKVMYYWGDIDTDGLAILSRLRQYYPEVKSLLMDQKTLNLFADLVVFVPVKSPEKTLDYLTDDEKHMYQKLQQESLRLEQERISYTYLQKCLLELSTQ